MTKPDPGGQTEAGTEAAFFRQPTVRTLLQAEQQVLRPLLAGVYGRHGVQVAAGGLPTAAHMLADSAIQVPLHWTLGADQLQGDVWAKPEDLPIQNASVNLIVLWHSLEFCRLPLRELARWAPLLAPGGVLFVVYFKPRSLWSLTGRVRPSLRIPGCLLSRRAVHGAMQRAGLDLLFDRSCYYRPPWMGGDRLASMERIGRWLPFSSAVGVAVGQRKVHGMTAIPMRRRLPVRGGILAESLVGERFAWSEEDTRDADARRANA